MNVYRALGGAGLAAALAVGGWYVLGQLAAPGLSALLLVGLALGLFFMGTFPLPQVSPRRRAALIGVAFLVLALGSPTAWLLGCFTSVGSVVLWKAYGAKIGEGESG